MRKQSDKLFGKSEQWNESQPDIRAHASLTRKKIITMKKQFSLLSNNYSLSKSEVCTGNIKLRAYYIDIFSKDDNYTAQMETLLRTSGCAHAHKSVI